MIRAVLFDMDGLIIDSEPLAKKAWQQTVAPFGLTIDEAMFGKMLGLRQTECSPMVCKWLGLKITPEELVRRRNALFMEMLPDQLRAMPGLFDLLDWLKG